VNGIAEQAFEAEHDEGAEHESQPWIRFPLQSVQQLVLLGGRTLRELARMSLTGLRVQVIEHLIEARTQSAHGLMSHRAFNGGRGADLDGAETVDAGQDSLHHGSQRPLTPRRQHRRGRDVHFLSPVALSAVVFDGVGSSRVQVALLPRIRAVASQLTTAMSTLLRNVAFAPNCRRTSAF